MKNTAIYIIVAVVAAAAAFYGGMQYQKSKTATVIGFGAGQGNFRFNGAGGQGQRGQFAGRGIGFRPVSGEILSVDDKSIAVKMQDGSSKIVLLSDSTAVEKTSRASREELKAGVKIAAFGQTNSDGSVTAQQIQLNPIMRMFGVSGGQTSPTPAR